MLATIQKQDITDQPFIQFNNKASFKKRKTIPQRAIPATTNAEDKFVQGIVNLDVYSVYAKNPELLLKCSGINSTPSTCFSNNTNPTISPSFDVNNNSLLNSSTSSPLISSGVIDMAQFRVLGL